MFPRYLRYSFVVLLFLVLENHLSQMCDTLKQKYDAPIRMNDLKGDTIARCRAYLDKIIGLPNLDDQIWGKLEDLSKIRNCIVHALGKVELSNDQKRLKDLATQGYGLSISDDEEMESGILTISTEFCATAVGDVREFFVRIFKAIEPESFDTIR